jgi:hypothetical protein
MASGATAIAQSQPDAAMAHLTGTVSLPGDVRRAGVFVALIADERTVATVQTDETGKFSIVAAPGRYDILITQNVLVRERIPSADLHPGEQSLGAVSLRVNEPVEEFVTLGEVVSVVKYPVSYLFKHPILYLKNLRHQL